MQVDSSCRNADRKTSKCRGRPYDRHQINAGSAPYDTSVVEKYEATRVSSTGSGSEQKSTVPIVNGGSNAEFSAHIWERNHRYLGRVSMKSNGGKDEGVMTLVIHLVWSTVW